jgi:hypothetical protein
MDAQTAIKLVGHRNFTLFPILGDEPHLRLGFHADDTVNKVHVRPGHVLHLAPENVSSRKTRTPYVFPLHSCREICGFLCDKHLRG